MTAPARYRKKPVVIEAIQWTEEVDPEELVDWINTNDGEAQYDADLAGPRDPETGADWGVLLIHTLEGELEVTPRDWVICGVRGEFYPCKPDIFAATYEPEAGVP